MLSTTTREPKGQTKEFSLALSVELRVISRVIARRQTQTPMLSRIVRIPFENEILIVRGDGSSNEHGSQLNIISCTKTQKYLLKGCHVFLAHVTTKKVGDKLEEKRLEDVPIVWDFPDVTPLEFQQHNGIPLGVLLHSLYIQVTENDSK
ncbi:hypothetical protein Tco_0424572 [Tanacetum coccineum]